MEILANDVPGVLARVAALVRQAHHWATFASTHARSDDLLPWQKAFQSLLFSVGCAALSYAVPSKLICVSAFQNVIRELLRSGAEFGLRMELAAIGGRIAVLAGSRLVGYVQDKHVAWVRPLIPFGIEVRLIRITGKADSEQGLGVTIQFTGVAEACERFSRQARKRVLPNS